MLTSSIVVIAFAFALLPIESRAESIHERLDRLGSTSDGDDYRSLAIESGNVETVAYARLSSWSRNSNRAGKDRIRRVVQLLGDRWHDDRKSKASDTSFRLDQARLRLLLMVSITHRAEIDLLLYGRGPKLYAMLGTVAIGSAPESKAARNLLKVSIRSRPRLPGTVGDPALIRVFRKVSDWEYLGLLGDTGSIPVMQANLQSKDPKVRRSALYGLGNIPDPASVPMVIPLLHHPDELRAGASWGKFGSAHYCLLRTMGKEHLPQLFQYMAGQSDLTQAFALNIVGYVADKEWVSSIRPYMNSKFERTRWAAINAISRIQSWK